MTILLIASLLLNIFLAFCGYYLSSELKKKENEMSAKEYRQRLIDIFQKTENEQYITLMVLPKESDLKLLESFLKEIDDE